MASKDLAGGAAATLSKKKAKHAAKDRGGTRCAAVAINKRHGRILPCPRASPPHWVTDKPWWWDWPGNVMYSALRLSLSSISALFFALTPHCTPLSAAPAFADISRYAAHRRHHTYTARPRPLPLPAPVSLASPLPAPAHRHLLPPHPPCSPLSLSPPLPSYAAKTPFAFSSAARAHCAWRTLSTTPPLAL